MEPIRGRDLWNFLVKKFNKNYILGVTKDKLVVNFQELNMSK